MTALRHFLRSPAARGILNSLRNFAVCGLLAVAGCVMLLTAGGGQIMLIIGIVLSIFLTCTADHQLSVWQLHLRKGERESIGIFSFRYIIYFAEKLVVAYLALRLSEPVSALLFGNSTFSLCWICFASAMAGTALIMFIRGIWQNRLPCGTAS